MSAGVNIHFALGNLGSDAEIRYTQKPAAVVTFRMACNERYKDQASGEWKEEPEWVNVVVFGARAEGLFPYLKEGSKVFVMGPQRTRPYTSQKDGVKRWVTETKANEIILLSTKDGRQIASAPAAMAAAIGSALAPPPPDDEDAPPGLED